MPLDIPKIFLIIADAVEKIQYHRIYKVFRENHKSRQDGNISMFCSFDIKCALRGRVFEHSYGYFM